MKFRGQNSSTKPNINLTALLDVVFILLIFFAVSTSFMYVGAIQVDLPKAHSSADGLKKEIVNVVVTKDNKIFIDKKQVDAKELQAALSEIQQRTPSATLMIEADTATMHGTVVTVIDAGKSAGFENFAIATEEPVR